MSKQMEKETENSGFLDGRDYTAAFLYKQIALIVGNGVYANELTPTAVNENMSITHGTGHAWANGVCYENAAPFTLHIGTADGSLNRYDSLVIRLNLSINEMYATIIQGTPDTAPIPPVITRNADIYDLKICDIYIPAGCTKITQAQIIDRRLDDSVCGVPVFPIEHLDMKTFYNQINNDLEMFRNNEQTKFFNWFDRVQERVERQQQAFSDFLATLSNDLNVLTYIQEYTNSVTLTENTNIVFIGISDFTSDEDVLFVSKNGVTCSTDSYTVKGTGAEAYIVMSTAETAGNTVEFRVLKSKVGTAALADTFALEIGDGAVLTSQGAVLTLE